MVHPPPSARGDAAAEATPKAPDSLNGEDRLRFERLLDRTLGRGFKMVMWEAPTPRDRAAVIDWLRPQLAARGARLLEVPLVQLLGLTEGLAPRSINVWSGLQRTIAPAEVADQRAVLVLHGFEDLMRRDDEGRPALLRQFNVQRDILARDYPCWWLLLVHPASRQIWRTVAPDFCDFVALWIESPLPAVESSATREMTLDKQVERSRTDTLGPSDWPVELQAADAAIRAAKLDMALDSIHGFRAATRSHPLTERDLAIADLLEGEILATRGDSNSALRRWRDRSLPVFRHLAEADPAHAEWQRDLSRLLDDLGDLAMALGNLAEAQRLFTESLRISQRLAEADPGNAGWQRNLWVSYGRVANVLEQLQSPEAVKYWRKAHDTLDSLMSARRFVSPADQQFMERLRDKIRHH